MICDILIRQNKGIKRILILLNAIDNFQFVKMTTDRKFDIFVTKASISIS